MARDPETSAHQEWLGFVQPIGLVVSIPALLAAEAYANRNLAPVQSKLLTCLPVDALNQPVASIQDFRKFAIDVLSWEESDVLTLPDGPLSAEFAELEVVLPEYGESLRPTFVVPEFKPKPGQKNWILLIQVLPDNLPFDEDVRGDKHSWQASPQAKFERLLRETEVPIGLLVNGSSLRLVYAPRGESSGFITFLVSNMMQVSGRPILGALHMLLSNERLFLLPEKQRLPWILAESRKYQNTVSTALSEQVLAALYELLRGFQSAHEQSKGDLLRLVLERNPDHVYAGLLTVLMRMVFLLYAEDRGLVSNSSIYSSFYSVSGLFERLREDAGRFPDTMDQRYGAWAQLLTLFRLIHDGGSHAEFSIPARKGHLFDPARYPFLEGRQSNDLTSWSIASVPHVSDGVVYRVLSNLLMLEGERLSYRTLDVEQIGSVYETIMGFSLSVADGPSIAIKAIKAHGAPTCINLEKLLHTKPNDRAKWLKENTDQDVTGAASQALKAAKTVDDMVGALEKKIALKVTPQVVPPGNMVLQPSDERRKSGSHYTPRMLTEPIVRDSLKPIFERLGTEFTPYQVLDLKVCDPAMGSGAFLVEACRQLGEKLVDAWHRTGTLPPIPPDEDEILHARRLVAQRCLYGVDRNPMAVDLTKLSLWLATLAKEHPFTFLDHTLRCGDSVVGLTREQIIRFHWEPGAQRAIDEKRIKSCIDKATSYRKDILENAENTLYPVLQVKLSEADKSLQSVRNIANAVLSAFFSSENQRQQELKRGELLPKIAVMLNPPSGAETYSDSLRLATDPVLPFHWEIEFPEVFERNNGGFDCVVGNPPFLGGSRISTAFGDNYLAWLLAVHPGSHGNADLVAHFFRRGIELLRTDGAFGLIATNTIAQGDTRVTGLQSICTSGNTIFAATRRLRWPGDAAVLVSVVHVYKGNYLGSAILDGREVPRISAFLYHSGGDINPRALAANAGKSFTGMKIYGQGFSFEETDNPIEANSIKEMNQLIEQNRKNAERILPYIGGEEINDSPTHQHRRYVIDFNDMSFEEASRWPDLLSIVERKVKPYRETQKRDALRKYWWLYGEKRPALRAATAPLRRVLVCSLHQPHWVLAFAPTGIIYSHALGIFAFETYASFAVLQSRVHEVWARFFASSMKDDLRYTPSDCFETFPFPKGFESNADLEKIGQKYYEFRSRVMQQNEEGLTKTFNRFHNPNEQSPEILELRDLHAQLDLAVLNAFGWTDLEPSADFILDYEEVEESPTDSARKKPYRLRWSDDFKDEVITRLMDLNELSATEEVIQGQSTLPRKKSKPKPMKQKDGERLKPTNTPDSEDRQMSLVELES